MTLRFAYRMLRGMTRIRQHATRHLRVEDLLAAADAWKEATGIGRDTTLSHRMFGDSKRLGQLREGRDITVGRFNAAMAWMAAHWPEGRAVPELLAPWLTSPAQNGAA